MKKGFTLIELIVVIAIMGILAAVAIPKYIDLTNQARKAADQGNLAGLRSATVMLYGSNILSKNTNSFRGYWPSYAQVTNSMSETTCVTWLYYTNVSYNQTTGVWTAYGSGF